MVPGAESAFLLPEVSRCRTTPYRAHREDQEKERAPGHQVQVQLRLRNRSVHRLDRPEREHRELQEHLESERSDHPVAQACHTAPVARGLEQQVVPDSSTCSP